MATRHVRILIACDEPSVIRALKLILADAYQDGVGFDFTATSRYDDLIEQATVANFDLVIVHINCVIPSPRHTLLAHSTFAIETIKARLLPVVAITTMPEWTDALRSAGANAVLTTPFTAEELRGAVSRFALA